jgi:hypothetical protein
VSDDASPGQPTTPESLAADFDAVAAWMATRPNGVTWTGDGLDGTVGGLRDAAQSIRKHLVPAWNDLAAGRDQARRELAPLRDQLDEAGRIAERWARRAARACDERDQANNELSAAAEVTGRQELALREILRLVTEDGTRHDIAFLVEAAAREALKAKGLGAPRPDDSVPASGDASPGRDFDPEEPY